MRQTCRQRMNIITFHSSFGSTRSLGVVASVSPGADAVDEIFRFPARPSVPKKKKKK